MGHAIYRLRTLEKERHSKRAALRRDLELLELEQTETRRRVERELRQLEQGRLNKAPLKGALLRTYVAHVVARSMLEVGFMMGQHILYGSQLEPLYRCECEPCPNSVDCFVSRPTEKSMFMAFMQVIAGVSLFLSLMEIVHLSYKKLKRVILDYYTHMQDDYCTNNSEKNPVHQEDCGTQGYEVTIPTAPVGGGYTLLLENKQTNGPSSAPFIGSSSTKLYSGSKSTSEGPKNAKESAPRPTKSQTNPNNLIMTNSICPAGTNWQQHRSIGDAVMKANTENAKSCAKCDKSTTSKSDSIGNMSSTSRRSPAPSPKRRISTFSSRRDNDLRI